ncbi:nucleoside recognition domain-containing protein [Cytobacillus firmus]|uniref:nucleoside recognition domain-containing protein n=1 Tax=Cytobacillus firmus TaxID=1399 RepID=UPI0018CDFB08|nr:nucleoside recognition domain-containing protein [Cytobacillus firmus]MBG9548702.1 membrane protein [Cytobacillus firmus]MBG9603212.1 membrane protein [Cytobacillus firmus]MBG9653519.1 membrane protein [Cytobacillus firmus]MED1906006.1 nucleoside recognition domain-containing protein [Cytobacillus firmus]MED1939053.1 nucleoside recognition domain-containing protein [Cytobacillus firmus]
MLVESSKKGLMAGLKTTWTLGKVIFPVTLIVALLQHTPVLPWVIKLITPLMNLIGLSGDAAIPLVLGNFLNLYAGIGAILTLDLTVKEVFIIAVMLSFSHNMLIETGVALKVGVKLWVVLTVRFGLALISAIVINLVWQGGSETAKYGFIPAKEEQVSGAMPILLNALQTALLGILQLAIIVIPLMIIIQILKDKQWLAVFSRWMAPVTRALGMKENTSTTLAAGLLIGLAYGAGVMIQAVEEDGVSKKDVTIAFIFLVACHAVVEDTLIFVPLGIPVLPLLLIRLGVAIILTLAVAMIWNRADLAKRKEATYEH